MSIQHVLVQNKWDELPPLTTSHSYQSGPMPARPSKPGQAALVFNGNMVMDALQDDRLIFDGLDRNCQELITYVKQWATQYGDRLSVTLVSMTKGFAAPLVPLYHQLRKRIASHGFCGTT